MVSPRVHLAIRRKSNGAVTACGLSQATRRSRVPAEVTCDRCRHTLLMADIEARTEHQRKSRSRKSRT